MPIELHPRLQDTSESIFTDYPSSFPMDEFACSAVKMNDHLNHTNATPSMSSSMKSNTIGSKKNEQQTKAKQERDHDN